MTFLCRYIGASTATSEEAQVIYTIWTESLHEYDLLQCKPSLIASSVIWLGRYSQISRENQENILIKGDNIEEKSTGMNKNGVVGKKGIKDKKVVKNDIIVNIVENVICDNNLLEQLSVCTKGYPWTSTLTHITGIFRVCNYFFFYLSHLSYFFVPFLYDIFVIFQNLFIENNLSVKFAKIDIKLGEVNTEQFAIAWDFVLSSGFENNYCRSNYLLIEIIVFSDFFHRLCGKRFIQMSRNFSEISGSLSPKSSKLSLF